MNKTNISLLLPVSALVISLASCSNNSADPKVPQSIADATVHDVPENSLPLRGYVLSTADVKVLENGRFMLEQACMREFGLDGITSTVPWQIEAQPTSERVFDYLDGEKVKKFGYHQSKDDTGAISRKIPRRTSLSPALRRDASSVLFGYSTSYLGKAVPVKGCAGEANRKLWGNYPADQFKVFPEDLALQSMSETSGDARIRKATELWVSCMKALGYRYSAPGQAAGEYQRSNKITSKEFVVAASDYKCRESSNLQKTWFEVESGNQNKLLQRYGTQLVQIRTAQTVWLSNARAAGG